MPKRHITHTTTIIMSSPKLDLPWLIRLKLFIFNCFRSTIYRSDGSVDRRIYNLIEFKSPPRTGTHVSTSDVVVNSSRNLWFRLFVPTTTTPNKQLPLILYLHGGGFSIQAPNSSIYDDYCRLLSIKIPAIIASVNYRLAPENRHPSQIEDGFDALKFIDSRNYDILPANIDLDKCFIAGDSAGGNIAHHVTVRACRNPSEFDKIKIVGLLLLQPFFGGEERTESETRLTNAPVLNVELTDKMWRAFLPEGADRDHPAANIMKSARLDADVSLFPKTLVIVGGYDPLVDWQRRYVEWIEECGKEVEMIEYPNHGFHGFFLFTELVECQMCIDELREFVHKQAS
ncbi:hypothetical protein CASFOL_001211 [Castilleja foliolosa]|uniref:Alpha/beta hydrolase fold-3 domain-containing protein n=1 Tax=Castilleja foliolosa TaxID=1961234 RepID=A0ABD3ELY0_9LAMI